MYHTTQIFFHPHCLLFFLVIVYTDLLSLLTVMAPRLLHTGHSCMHAMIQRRTRIHIWRRKLKIQKNCIKIKINTYYIFIKRLHTKQVFFKYFIL